MEVRTTHKSLDILYYLCLNLYVKQVYVVAEQQVWYEQWPSEVGPMSLQALEAIAAEPPVASSKTPRRWLRGDHEAFWDVIDFEHYVDEEQGLPSDAPPDVRRDLHRDLSAWRAALPFSEAERRLVLDAYDYSSIGELASVIRRRYKEEEVVDAGIRHVIRGRDLVHQWWAWRREMDEFAGQGSLAQAKGALIRFSGRLMPPEKLPDIYFDLQGLVRPVPYRGD